MSSQKFVVQEEHFHIAKPDCYVLTGFYRETEPDGREEKTGDLKAFLGHKPMEIQVLRFADDSVRQKYAKYDLEVSTEYVVIVKLPENLSGYQRLVLKAGEETVYRRFIVQLRSMRRQLNYRITNTQITGADYVLSGWVASEKPVKLTVYDRSRTPVQCEVSHFPRTDVALEYRESENLTDSGFSVTVPMNGRKRLILQISDGIHTIERRFSAVDANRLGMYAKKAYYYMKRNGIKKAFKRLVNELYEILGDTGNYMKWRKKNTPSQKELERQKKTACAILPVIYVITPEQPTHHLDSAAASLAQQTYQNWKWVIAATATETEKLKERLAAHVDWSQVLFVPVEGQAEYQQRIASAISCVLEQAGTGDSWLTFLGPADVLEPHALYECVSWMSCHPKQDFLYTDEDQISEDGKTYKNPIFKSDLNIDMLRAMNYFGHMVLVRGDLARKLEPWNVLYDTEASYDYFLRACEHAQQVGHLPKVVYHARETGKPAGQYGKQILNAHYIRLGIPAEAEPSPVPGIYRTKYHWPDTPLVSVNIPNKDHVEDLDTCVQSLLKLCTYPNYEIVIIENNSEEERTFAYYKKIQEQDARVRVIYWTDIFNYAGITNFGVKHSRGDYILLLNNDTEVITTDFMEELLGYCMREDVGVCGARLFYFDDTIQHAGVIIGLGGICGEGFQGFPKENGGYQNRIFCPQDYNAVTAACLMTKKSIFEEVGGMDEELQVAYNDIDYCLKGRKTGKLVVYNPFACLHHYEYKSRGTENTPGKLARYNREVDIFTNRWADIISNGDEYYNPNLTKRYQDFSLRRIELLP